MMAASQFASLRSCDHLSADIPFFLQGVLGLFPFLLLPHLNRAPKTDPEAL